MNKIYELGNGSIIQIPENCKARIEYNRVIIEYKKDADYVKDGDILCNYDGETMAIFKEFEDEDCKGFSSYYNTLHRLNQGWSFDRFYPASDEEKQKFYYHLNEKGLQWNAETKTMERVRKRAKLNERYLYINSFGEVIEEIETNILMDDKNYDSGNYYLLEERSQAEEDARAIRAVYKHRLNKFKI